VNKLNETESATYIFSSALKDIIWGFFYFYFSEYISRVYFVQRQACLKQMKGDELCKGNLSLQAIQAIVAV
jgi:hypothetical protein